METKIIKNFENYTISDTGIVTNIKTGRVLKQSLSGGYKQLCLSNNGKQKQFFLHQLLIKTFNRDYDPKTHDVDHIDKNKLNNNLENLRIVTTRQNTHNKKYHSVHGIGVSKSHIKYKTTIYINKNIYLGSFDTAEEAYSKYKQVSDQLNNLDLDNKKYKVVKVKKDNEYHLIFLIN